MDSSGSWPFDMFEEPALRIEDRASAVEVLEDCALVLLTATREEAAPLLAALTDARAHELATKTIVVGRLLTGRGSSTPDVAGEGSEYVQAVVAVGGCDKTNTAHMLTCLLEVMAGSPPTLVMQVGIAGGFEAPGESAPTLGDIVLATEEVYADAGSSSPDGWLSADDLGLPSDGSGGRGSMVIFPLDEQLVRRAAAALAATMEFAGGEGQPKLHTGRCLTSSRITGLASEAAVLASRWGALAESMEGAAAAQICSLYRVPFLEVRGISNTITDRDRASWRVEEAIAVSGRAALTICDSMWDALAAARPDGRSGV